MCQKKTKLLPETAVNAVVDKNGSKIVADQTERNRELERLRQLLVSPENPLGFLP